jgi:hypothetical protein
MITLHRHGKFLAVMLLLMTSSCRKDAPFFPADAGNPSNKKTTTGLVQGPPTITWWAYAHPIPYASELPNDVLDANDWPIGFAVNGKGFACGTVLQGDYTSKNIRDLWEYDASSVTWVKKTPFPGNPVDLIEAANFVIGDNAYIVTGNATWRYNEPADAWSRVSFVPALSRLLATAFSINGKGYMGLGFVENNGLQDMNDWWEYDPVMDEWTQRNNFPGGRGVGRKVLQ